MDIGFIGLGKMGSSMVERLLSKGNNVTVYDPDDDVIEKVVKKGASGSLSLEDLVSQLDGSRIIWVMVPSGNATKSVLEELSKLLKVGDIIIDGGNSNYKETIKMAELLGEKGVKMLDAGTSGGVWGLQNGYCIMVGGDKDIFKKVEPLFKDLTEREGYGYMGPSGSGHYVKMVHNGIEYAMLQAYGEGFEILQAKKEFDLDLKKISSLWNNGSVVRSWILELAEIAFKKDSSLSDIAGYVDDSGEGRWTVAEAIENDVPAPVITLSLMQRFSSRQNESFSAKVIAALRNEFGGHAVKKIKSQKL